MFYLKRVFSTLRSIHWDSFGSTMKHMIYAILVIIVGALCYWPIDKAVNFILSLI